MPGPLLRSTASIDLYSVRVCVQSGLAANGWTGSRAVPVKLASNGWPKAEEITLPSIYVDLGTSNVAGIELGSHGKERAFNLYIYAKNEPMKIDLAEEVVNLFRDGTVHPLAFVTGEEASAPADGSYELDQVGWRPVVMPASSTEVDRHRATVSAIVRRVDA